MAISARLTFPFLTLLVSYKSLKKIMLKQIKSYIDNKIPEDSPIRLLYHRFKAMLAALIYFFPSNNFNVIAVTGTKGKSTSCSLITAILEEAGKKVAMSTSINLQIGNEKWVNTSKMTTMSPFALQKFFKTAYQAGCEYVVLEVSSHAVTQSRVWGVNFDTVALTHIEKDHLEYHGSLEEYVSAKEKLFKNLNGLNRKPNISKVMVLNEDDSYFERFNEHHADLKMTYGLNRGTVHPKNIQLNADKSSFVLSIPNNQIDVTWSLMGTFNIANALLAAAVGIANGINLTIIKSALEKVEPIPGRLERIEVGQPYTVIVDYAHTTDSLTKLCSLYKPLTKGKLILIFGCTGGGRDKAKRPLMGEVADQFADLIILTNDDPYDEEEMNIINDIAVGIKRKEGEGLWKIVSRKEAVHLALMMAKTGDTVILTGKGCEEVQIIRGERVPWDDRRVVHDFLSRTIEIEIDTGEMVRGNACLEG
ncbi:hypothetical protein A2272_03405 [Candidatus Peregrinibacteria bacterium RIFOXYA12_FULL_33_12]|nr:MAG: hypothetical protein A2263_05375 [Candidatus Peregrinibacteria bacterium RIFOXYA2_FULL_33_21]OGJ46300.1 MAG: hypothetical protein A2272_03405 [Candidatus Peregrinibacteria bacterium RIFOXYA12_FULL_33_12]OGJ50821.1 MAG: hypothetical protein A2307_02145 [Candidatus Peregrinibacteria bacterium RIFOXYB2_FULL_33_20]